jgi:hypothetical protein
MFSCYKYLIYYGNLEIIFGNLRESFFIVINHLHFLIVSMIHIIHTIRILFKFH